MFSLLYALFLAKIKVILFYIVLLKQVMISISLFKPRNFLFIFFSNSLILCLFILISKILIFHLTLHYDNLLITSSIGSLLNCLFLYSSLNGNLISPFIKILPTILHTFMFLQSH